MPPVSRDSTRAGGGDASTALKRAPAPEKKSIFRRVRKGANSVRAHYLDYLAKDVGQRLKGSLHNVRFMDIGVDEKPNAAVPWHYRALDEQQRFATFDEAFEYYEGRVLLLGTPGSGKTTTLLNLAQKLIAEAQQDEDAPVPLLFNLSKFASVSERKVADEVTWLRKVKEQGEKSPARVFEQWLVQMLVEMPVEGLNRQVAQQWVEGNETALLLDGLDEVSDNYVLALAEIMSKSYLRERQSQIVVVCSRLIEYQPLQDNEDARLRLNGAVVLQTPTREQIDAYLKEAKAHGLRDVLRDDEVLYEMALTPLTLSMMTLAYDGQAPTDIPRDLPFLERRRELLDIYVKRMVQRTARRPLGTPFNPGSDKDVPPRYPLTLTYHYLGWLAVKLSERMKTLFPPGRLYSFLSEKPADVEVGVNGVKYGVAGIAAWLIAALTCAGLLAGGGRASDWVWLALSPLLAPLAVSFAALRVKTKDTRWGSKTETLNVALVTGFVFFYFGLANRALPALLPWRPSPLVTAVLGLAVLIFVASLGSNTPDKMWLAKTRVIAWRCVKILSALAAAGAITAAAAGAAYTLEGVTAAACVLAFRAMRPEFDDVPLWKYSLVFVLIGTGAVALTYWLGLLTDGRELSSLIVAVTVFIGIFSSVDRMIGVPLSLGPAVVLANAVGGPAVAVWAGVGVWLLHLSTLEARAARAAEWLLLTPLVRVVLALGRKTCFRYRPFLDYSADTMLLKHVGTEYEFVHRLLRDHFAIRELIPVVTKAEGEKRLAVIQRLSRQGDSSFDALANLATHTDAQVRRAAVEGLGRIAIPKVVPIMWERAQQDPDEVVRAAVMQSLGKFAVEEQIKFFMLAMKDASVEVRRAAVASTRNSDLLGYALTDESDVVFRQALVSIASITYFIPPHEMLNESVVRRLGATLRDSEGVVTIGVAVVMPVLCNYLPYWTGDRETSLASVGTVLPTLLDRCDDKNPTVRTGMVEAISSLSKYDIARQRPEVKTALMRALKDRDSRVRMAAISGLANLPSPETLAVLRASLNSGEDGYKSAVITVLGEMRDPLAVPTLMGALDNPKLRYAAAIGLGRIADQSIVPELMRRLERKRRGHLPTAIMALAMMRVDAAAPRLRQILMGTPERGRRYLAFSSWSRADDIKPYAAKALGLLNDMEALPTLLDVSPHKPTRLLFAQFNALRHYPQKAGVQEMLAKKIEQLSPAEQENLLGKVRAFLGNDAPDGDGLWALISQLMASRYKGRPWSIWGEDYLFFISELP